MKIAICDDIPEQLTFIKNATLEYFKGRKDIVDINTFNNAFNFLDAQGKIVFDLVLLDVCMPGLLGTKVAGEIRMRKDKTEIIFLTTSPEFAVDAFEVNAVHYLIKPFTQMAFNQAMDRAMQLIDQKSTKMVYLKGPKGIVQAIDKDSISYIEADAHRQSVFLNDGTMIETVETLAELYNTLQDLSIGQFIMPYKGFIVNQHAISKIENDKIILKNNKRVPIPRRTFSLIKKAYFDYMFGDKK